MFILQIIVNVQKLNAFNPSLTLKTGVNFNQYDFSKKYSEKFDKFPYYSSNPSLIVGLSKEINLNNKFYIVNDLYYKYTNLKYSIYTTAEEIIESDMKCHYIIFSSMTGFRFLKIVDFLIGADFGKRIQGYLDVESKINYQKYSYKITDKLPNIDVSLSFGLSKKIDYKSFEVTFEIKYLVGLTKYKYPTIGEWCNHGPQFIVGFSL